MGRPILFKQARPGLRGRIFFMYKFRTMLLARNKEILSDEARITNLGRFLRSSSLDEIPELFNVIKGDMSLIGPRPLLVEYLDKYTSRQMQRHDVLPGVTGLAQVKGRNNLSWKNKFRYDVFYVDNMNWKMDLYIMLKTIKIVLLKTGFKASGEPKKFGE
jgi:lipopolysaccharide/colanic/teichoic acid biosynthesis glycosyltransferase